MTGRCLCSWLTEARSREVSHHAGSDTYARALDCHWRRSRCPEVSRVIETVFPGIGEGMEILAEPSPAPNCAQRAAWEMLGQPESCEP